MAIVSSAALNVFEREQLSEFDFNVDVKLSTFEANDL